MFIYGNNSCQLFLLLLLSSEVFAAWKGGRIQEREKIIHRYMTNTSSYEHSLFPFVCVCHCVYIYVCVCFLIHINKRELRRNTKSSINSRACHLALLSS